MYSSWQAPVRLQKLYAIVNRLPKPWNYMETSLRAFGLSQEISGHGCLRSKMNTPA